MVNAAAGSVRPGAAAELEAMIAGFGLEVRVAERQPSELVEAVEAAVAAKPDLVVVLAGDGTARLAAALCGPDGPLVAPLPGGTMNVLPKALYGVGDWREALRAAIEDGEARTISGGQVEGQPFYVGAILGAPALWADAREAVRVGKLTLAAARAKRAFHRAFSGRLRYVLDGAWIRKAEALNLMCPLVSHTLNGEQALAADALDPRGVAEALRIGLKAALGGVVGDWRNDPSVASQSFREGRAWANGRIPVLLDGEPHRFEHAVTFGFVPRAFRALAPRLAPPPMTPAQLLRESLKPGG